MNQHERFERDGYVIHAASVLPSDLLQRAISGLESVRNGVYNTGEEPAGRGWNPGDDSLKLCKIEQPQLANDVLREVLRSPELGRLAAEVAGAERVQVWWVQGLVKPGTAGVPANANVGWHQDSYYWGAWEEGSELFTAWLALSDVSADSGPMVFVPGSHRWGLLKGGDFFGQDQEKLRSAIQIPEGESWREVPDILSPGGVSFHHRLVFHGSHQNTSTQPRCSLAIHMRTEKSSAPADSWVAKYLDRPEICPVIYGS